VLKDDRDLADAPDVGRLARSTVDLIAGEPLR
jgi:hypothetical protein